VGEHGREVSDVCAAVIDGLPTLFGVDYGTIRRWDAATGTPWPAPITGAAAPAGPPPVSGPTAV
jgi:hypothetical protein